MTKPAMGDFDLSDERGHCHACPNYALKYPRMCILCYDKIRWGRSISEVEKYYEV